MFLKTDCPSPVTAFEAMCRDGHLHYRDGFEAWDALYQTISDRGHAWLESRHWTPCFKQK